MKVDALIQQQLIEKNQSQTPQKSVVPSYFLWDQLNITLFRSSNYGYGIAISGGSNTSSQDSAIYVSDIVPGGPAENKLIPDDIILSVNGVNVENVEHEFVIRLLKEAKDFIHLVVKRKAVPYEQSNNNNTNGSVMTVEQLNSTGKRHNLAIQQTAATVMANYTNTYQNGHKTATQITGNNLMSNMMNGSTTISSLKPIKLTFNRKDKKELYGIVVGCKYYIKEILPNSLAANEPNLKHGDILLKLNDFEIEQISLIEANRILSKSKENKLHLVVKRNSSSSSEEEDVETEDEQVINELPNALPPQQQQENTTSTPQHHQQNNTSLAYQQASDVLDNGAEVAQVIHTVIAKVPPPLPPTLPPQTLNQNHQQQAAAASTPPGSAIKQLFKQTKPSSGNETNHRFAKFFSNKNSVLNYRTVVFARENGIGVRLAGGNKVGIFICDVQYNSPAERAGLRIADKLIKVNNVDYLTLTREEAVQHILSIQHMIEMVVAHAPEEYETNAFDPHGGDSFYVRSHFNFLSRDANDLTFRINDILHVTDTLYNGVIGQWVASKLNSKMSEEPFEDIRGTVPNIENAEKMLSQASTIDQVIAAEPKTNETAASTNGQHTASSGFASLGASARMSIRKRLAGKNSLAKRSRSASRIDSDHLVNSNVKVSKANTYLSNKYTSFERVVLREVNFARPIVLFGPLADVAREKLKGEFPGKYEIPDSYSTSPTEPNGQVTGVIKLASIKAIIEKGKHSLLDITPNAVDHLNYAQYFPICVYLKSTSRGHTKELRQKYAKNLKAKSSRRLYDNAVKLESFYSHLFTATLTLDSNQWFKKLKEIIEVQQSQPIWISEELDQFLMSNEKQQQELEEQQQIIENQAQMMIQNSSYSPPQNNLVFDDNFEFPIYTAANQPFGMSGAASSTYSLYEDSANYNRSSFAASDSDIGGGGVGSASFQSKTAGDISSQQHQNQMSAALYSTNFNCSKSNSNNGGLPSAASSSSNSSSNQPFFQGRVKSEPNIPNNGQDFVENGNQSIQQQYQQHIMNSYEVNNISNKNYNSNEQGISNETAAGNAIDNNSWKKFATYSANSLRNLTKKILPTNGGVGSQNDQLSDSEIVSRKKSALALSSSQTSTPSKMLGTSNSNPSPLKSRPALLMDNSSMIMMNAGGHFDYEKQAMHMSTEESANFRNSALSNYILIKNSQSALMGGPGQAQTISKQISTGSLLLPTNLMGNDNSLENKMNNLKLNKTSANNLHREQPMTLYATEIKYSNEAVKFKLSTYGAHYNDNGVYRKLSLDSNSNCSIIASANGIFDSNGGILESADTGVSLNVPEGAIAPGVNFDLYFKVCHCKSNLTNGKGELLTNPIVMCGPRGIRFLKPVELQIPHFISIDGKSWSYAFKTSENISEEDPYSWTRFYKKTLIDSVTVLLDSF